MKSNLTRLHALWVTCFLCELSSVNGHAYVYWPASRNRIKFWYLAQSQNAPPNSGAVNSASGFTDYKSKWGAPPDGRNGPRTDTAWAWDLCGQGPDPGTQKAGDSWKNWAGPPVATYKQGGNITFTLVVNGEHGGAHEWRLCPKKVDSSMSLKEAAACIDSHFIGRSCTPGDGCGCADDKCKTRTPHNDKSDPIYKNTIPESAPKEIKRSPDFLAYGAHIMTYTLPADVYCEECTIQWYWATAYGEWFRNCIDIKIERGPAPPPSPMRRRGGGAPSPTPDRRRAPTPPTRRRGSPRRRSTRRRRRNTRRRKGGGSRRRRKSGGSRRRKGGGSRRRSSSVVADTPSRLGQASRETHVDMEYAFSGCFPLVAGDAAADHLPCDCDTGDGPRLYDTLRDYTCMHHSLQDVCRSGLPFYRLLVNKDAADRLCFSFCASKGADLFGLLGLGNASAPEAECRCGASVTNYKFWETAGHKLGASSLPHPSLILQTSHKLKACAKDDIRVYKYEGWKSSSGSSGVQDALVDIGEEDKDYMASVVAGYRVKAA